MPRRFSIAHLSVIELDPPSVVSCAAAAGYDMADLRLLPVVPSDASYPVFGDTPMRRELLQRLDDTGLQISDVELIRLRAGIDFSACQGLLEIGARLGARYVKVACLEDDEALSADLIARAAEAAAPYNLTVDLEFMVFTGVKTLEAACRVIRASGASNATVLVDALHLDRSGGTPADAAAIDPSLIAYLHICDAPSVPPPSLAAITEEARIGRMIPGEGGLPLVELIAALPEDCLISVELPMKDWANRVAAPERTKIMLEASRRVAERADALRSPSNPEAPMRSVLR